MRMKKLNKVQNILFGLVLLVAAVAIIMELAYWVSGCAVVVYPCHKCHRFKRLGEMWDLGDKDQICIECYMKEQDEKGDIR